MHKQKQYIHGLTGILSSFFLRLLLSYVNQNSLEKQNKRQCTTDTLGVPEIKIKLNPKLELLGPSEVGVKS